jgi:hypothetical protein
MDDIIVRILALSKRLAEVPTDDAHHGAVQAQLAFANQIFEGIGSVCEKGNGLSGETLLRTLFEAVSGAIILAKHPEKLGDFIEHGRMTELRMMRVIESPPLKERLEATLKATEAEFQRLWAKFNENRWHGLGTKASFADAEFEPSVYDRYYRRASAIAHGQPYVTVRHGQVRARPTAWKNLSFGARNMAMLMMVTLLVILNREFKLGVDDDLAHLRRDVDARLQQHMGEILNVADANKNATA